MDIYTFKVFDGKTLDTQPQIVIDYCLDEKEPVLIMRAGSPDSVLIMRDGLVPVFLSPDNNPLIESAVNLYCKKAI